MNLCPGHPLSGEVGRRDRELPFPKTAIWRDGLIEPATRGSLGADRTGHEGFSLNRGRVRMSAIDSGKQANANISNLLAKERTREAAERTILAWVRTSLSLISFGFGIYKIVQALSPPHMHHHHPMTVIFALSFIVLGIFSMFAATVQHIQLIGRLELDDDPYKPKRPLGSFVGVALTLIGLFALISVIVELFILKV